jgi:hypothetical protein
MNKKTRRILSTFFIILFIIITTAVSLYASGYKLILSWPIHIQTFIQKTGSISVNTIPEGALVYLNSKPQSDFIDKLLHKKNYKITPTKIQNLEPKTYNLSLQKESYWPIEQTVEVNPGQVSIIKDLQFIKKDLPMFLYRSSIQELIPSYNLKYVLLTKDNSVFDLKNESIINTPNLNSLDQNDVLWSIDDSKIYDKDSIIDLENPNLNINNLLGNSISNLKCDINSDHVYYQYNDSLNYFDVSSQINKKILDIESCQDFLISDRYIYVINNSENKSKLNIYKKK